ncbi:hypothetical protein GIB67_036716 [Kingdonia uniflora]|uniref:Uncharacterized protein n=1 Tax=Kingdonia uniflora TaxID=39325 RepID=A0A7J7LWN0_9MAGN|nr:hypothetical protein GIB67_036716 [Kingdonia uniflora]
MKHTYITGISLSLKMSNDVENLEGSEAQKISETPLTSCKIQETWFNSLLQQASIYGITAGYCLSASLLSIINKWEVMKFLYPGALIALQYFTSATGVLLCGQVGVLAHDLLNLRIMR